MMTLIDFERLTLSDLIMARQWLDGALALVSPSSAGEAGRALRKRLAEVDEQLWTRLVDDNCPWRKHDTKDAGNAGRRTDKGDFNSED